jgi:hypothetical protein
VALRANLIMTINVGEMFGGQNGSVQERGHG